jgi:hypothetical protein
VVGKLWREMGKRITSSAVCLTLLVGVWGCSQQSSPISMADNALKGVLNQNPSIEEVSPPVAIQQLRQSLPNKAPQVKIVGLKPDATIEQTTASIRFDVDDFSIFKDPELDLGPHLTVVLDEQPYTEIYDAKQSITLTDLKPGTHKLQVFASTPWHESLKTSGALDQISFNVFAPTQANRVAASQPLLIYGQPEGEYGAEPILLDYILTSATGQMKPNAKVRVTINGNSFVTEEQPPLYLKGFKPGTNWVKVEVLGRDGKAIAPLSETIQLVTLKPGGTDTLSKLIRGDLDAKDAEQIVSLDASQRRAEQKREALATPKPTPTPQPIEKKVEEKPEVLVPVPAVKSIPAKASMEPAPAKASTQPAPAQASTQPASAVSQPAEQNVPVAPKQPTAVEPKPAVQENPTIKNSPSLSTPKQASAKPTVEQDDPIQSFLSRFRPPSPAPRPLVSPEPKFVMPSASGSEGSEKKKVGDHMTAPPTSSVSTPAPKTTGPSTAILTKVTDTTKPVSEPPAMPILEKTATEKPVVGENFPTIAWKKFLKLTKGEDQNSPKLVTPPTPKPVSSPLAKPEQPEPTAAPTPKIDFAVSKTDKL